MAWVKVEDQLPNNLKVMSVPPVARYLYVCGLCMCAHQLTDGEIPGPTVQLLLAQAGATKKHAQALVDAGLWVAEGGGFRVPDYLEYNPSGTAERDRRDGIRAKRAAAGRKGAAARWGDSNAHGKGDGKPMASAMASEKQRGRQPDGPVPVPDLVTSSVTASEGAPDPGGGGSNDTATAIVDQAVDQYADPTAAGAGNPAAYRQAAANRYRGDPRLAQIADLVDRRWLTIPEAADRLHDPTLATKTREEPLDA